MTTFSLIRVLSIQSFLLQEHAVSVVSILMVGDFGKRLGELSLPCARSHNRLKIWIALNPEFFFLKHVQERLD